MHGEVYALETPPVRSAWLDEYEGLVPGNPNAGEYARVERPVRLATGETVTAWVYVYHGETAKLARVLSGRWSAEPR